MNLSEAIKRAKRIKDLLGACLDKDCKFVVIVSEPMPSKDYMGLSIIRSDGLSDFKTIEMLGYVAQEIMTSDPDSNTIN